MDVEFKPPHENGTKKEEKTAKRSRSNTPQLKKKHDEGRKQSKTRRNTSEQQEKPTETQILTEEPKPEVSNGDKNDEQPKNGQEDQKPVEENIQKEETVEMDSLVLSVDEPDPELQFDDNSDDLESGKVSPVLRCFTRRSQTRNIPTPKTPKSIAEDVDSKNSSTPTAEEVEQTVKTAENESVDSFNSVKVEVGGDSTRLNSSEWGFLDDSAYLNASRERSLSETLRNLSSRRTIRPISTDYRKQALQNRNHLQLNDNLERVHGLKRKERSETPEERKKFKIDPSSLFSRFTSPLMNLKNKLGLNIASSTPKLTAYQPKDDDLSVNNDDIGDCIEGNEVDGKKNWCILM